MYIIDRSAGLLHVYDIERSAGILYVYTLFVRTAYSTWVANRGFCKLLLLFAFGSEIESGEETRVKISTAQAKNRYRLY